MALEPAASPQIFTYLGGRIPVRCHEHVAIVHRGEAAADWGAEFLAEGLHRGERCCCVVPPGGRRVVVSRLLQLGVEARGENLQALQFPPEAPSTGELLEWGKKLFAEAEAAGAAAVRWLEEGVWTGAADCSVAHFFELHSRLNYLVKQYPSVILCSYDWERLEVATLFSAIAVHRHLLVENTLVRDNPFYVPPEKLMAMNPEDREHDLREIYREVGFDLHKLLAILAGYGQLQEPAT